MIWRTLHHLWQIGLLHPVAVKDFSIRGELIPIRESVPEGRLSLVSEGREGRFYADLGIDVADDAPLRPLEQVPSVLKDSLLWHPFQLWAFHQLDQTLRNQYAWSLALCGPERHREHRDRIWESQLTAVREFGQDGRHRSFIRLLALLLAVEPLIHSWVFPTIRMYPEDYREYWDWREAEPAAEFLGRVGLSTSDSVEWHRTLAFVAEVADPLENFRKLFRHADRHERERLKDKALLAHSLYDTAEILRRYLEQYHDCCLPEESDIRFPPWNERVNLQRYGVPRPSDYTRASFRRIARQFGVDPGYRLYCFVEGKTEVEYIRRWATNVGADLDLAGTRVVSLGGKDNIAVFEDQLRRLREEEIFVVVCVDFDHPARSQKQARQIKTLERFEADGLLPVEFTVWRPNFVQHNFATHEVIESLNQELARRDIGFVLDEKLVELQMDVDEEGVKRNHQRTLEDAVDDIFRRQIGTNPIPKGENLARVLADWATANAVPPDVADSEGNRPIDSVCAMLLHGESSDYPLTVQRWRENLKNEQVQGEV